MSPVMEMINLRQVNRGSKMDTILLKNHQKMLIKMAGLKIQMVEIKDGLMIKVMFGSLLVVKVRTVEITGMFKLPDVEVEGVGIEMYTQEVMLDEKHSNYR